MSTRADDLLGNMLNPAANNDHEDPLDHAMRREAQSAASVLVMQANNPDAAGRANRLARANGYPVSTVERNLPTFEAADRARQARDAVAKYPQLAGWITSPRNAAVAADDLDQLGHNSALWNRALQVPQPLVSKLKPTSSPSYLGASFTSGLHSVLGAVLGLVDQINPFTTSVEDINILTQNDPAARDRLLNRPSVWTGAATYLSRTARSEGDRSRAQMSELSAQGKDPYSGLVYGTLDPSKAAYLSPTRVAGDILQSLPSTAVLALTAFLTRGASTRAEALAAAAGATEAEAAAIGVKAAQTMAVRVGAAGEGAVGYQMQKDQTRSSIEAMPFDQLEKAPEYRALRSKGMDPSTARMALAADAGQRAGIGAGLIDAITNVASGPILGRLIGEGGALASRAVKGAATEGVQEAVQSAGEQVAGNAAERSADPDRALTDGVVENMLQGLFVGGITGSAMTAALSRAHNEGAEARRAHDASVALDDAMTSAAESKTRQRDPDAYEELIGLHTQDTAGANIFVPAESLTTYFQAHDIDPQSDNFWGPYAQQINEAMATGGDVVIPTSQAAAHLAGTPAWDAIKADARTSPGGMSQSEAASWEAAHAENMQRMGADVADQIDAQIVADAPRQKIYSGIRDQLSSAGFTQDAAHLNAELVAQRYATRAERLGQPLTGDEAANIQINNILPPALAPIVAADSGKVALKSVVNVMRRGLGVKTQQGPSLVEWIAKNGGIEDRGGDLTAMGAAEWHKGKPGKRKLIRPHDDGAQGSMLGRSEQQNANSPDELAVRAQEAGFFPAGERPTVNDLLDAVGDELRGAPRYAENQAGDADRTRAAADELAQLLDQSGLDPRTATEREIETAIDTYRQAQEGGYRHGESTPRGQISFPDGTTVIDLFQSRDASTFLHEMSHKFVVELQEDAAAGEGLSTDWEVTKAWFAANGAPVGEDGTIPVDAHELWARGFERFVMEGKSPSSALRRVFDAFRALLLNVYKHVDNLRAPITPEIRGVMQRMIATDEEIADASEREHLSALFTDAAQAGMTEAEFAAYQAVASEARDEAHDALLYRTMSTIRRERTKAWKDEETIVRADVTTAVNARPEFKALHLLRTGRMLDDPEAPTVRTRLDKAWLLDKYGEGILSALPKGVPPIFAETDTMNADDIAEAVGFPTGDDLVRTLVTVEERTRELRDADDKRSVRQALIDQRTADMMRERHGDPLNDGSIEEDALAAVHNEKQGETIAAELRSLGRRSGRQPTPYALAKEWAARKIASGTVQETISGTAMQRYARAAAKAGREAEKAMVAHDIDATFRHKRAQLLNNALIAEAGRVREQVTTARDRLAGYAKRRTMKSMDQAYLDRIHDLLERVEFKTRTQANIDRQGSFEEWARAREGEGFDIVVPASFAESLGTTHWSRLTVETMIGLDDTVKQIAHLGRFKQKLIDEREARDFDDARGEVLGAIGMLPQMPVKPNVQTWVGKKREQLAGLHANLTKMARMIDVLDDGDPNGPLNRYVWRPLANARHRENDVMADVARQRLASLEQVSDAIKKRFGELVNVPEMPGPSGDTVWTRTQLHQIARNAGVAENWRVLSEGRGWDQQAAMAALDREMTKEEWEFVQRDLDHIGSFWPEIEAMYRRINGVAPPKVEARTIETRHGTFAGGYYPLVPDTTANHHLEPAMRSDELFDTLFTRATTRNGFTNERTGATYVVAVTPAISQNHIGQVVHDFTHREALMQADKFLSDTRIVTAMRDAIGLDMQRQFRPWLKYIANETATDQFGTGALETIANKTRTSMSIMGMGLRIGTMLQQVAGYANSIEVLGSDGEAWMLSGAKSVASMGLRGSFDFAAERSGVVRHRMNQVDRTQEEELAKLEGKRGLAADARRFAFHGIGYMDRAVIVPTWHAGYNKGIAEGMTEEDAIAFGDRAVEASQGGAGAMNTAAIQRQKGLASLLVMFFSYGSAVYNRQAQLGRDWKGAIRERKVADVPRLLARTWWLMVAPNIITALIRQALGNGPDDDENYAGWLLLQTLTGNLTGLPVVGSLANAAASGFDFQASPLDRAGSTVINSAKDIWHSIDDYVPAALPGADPDGETHVSKRAVRNTVESVGYATSLPLGQVTPAAQFLTDWANGSAHPETAREWYLGLTKGKVEKD